MPSWAAPTTIAVFRKKRRRSQTASSDVAAESIVFVVFISEFFLSIVFGFGFKVRGGEVVLHMVVFLVLVEGFVFRLHLSLAKN
jgi:hypothetical protein